MVQSCFTTKIEGKITTHSF